LWLRQRGEELKEATGGREEAAAGDELETESQSQGISIQRPEVFCEDMSLPDKTPQFHTVVLKWRLDFGVGRSNESTSPRTTPIVFVLQRMDVKTKDPQWETRGKVRHTYTRATSLSIPDSLIIRYGHNGDSTHSAFKAIKITERLGN